jgi:hypothetical protein
MRQEPSDLPGFAIVMVGLGVVIAMAFALQPYFDAAYRLDVPTLAAGMTPYLVFGVLAVLMPDRTALGAGGAVLAVHALVGIQQRYLTDDYLAGQLLVVVPLLLAALLLALAPWARGSLGFPRVERRHPVAGVAQAAEKTTPTSTGEVDRAA